MSKSRLLTLPGEIQNQIITELDGLAQLTLRAVCKQLHEIIPITYRLLLAAEKCSQATEMDLYACYTCLRLRRHVQFSDSMRKGKRGKNGAAPDTRFCIDCGLDNRRGPARYTRSDLIVVQGVRHVICLKCDKYCLPARPYKAHAKGMALCVECYEPLADTYAEEDRRVELLSLENKRIHEEFKRFEERLRLQRAGFTQSEIEVMIDIDLIEETPNHLLVTADDND